MKETLRPALVLFAGITIVTGIAYPLLVTAIAQTVFRDQANGSLLRGTPSTGIPDGAGQEGERVVGSALIGQQFSDARYFWGRPSATGPDPYAGAASGGSNLASTNPALAERVSARVAELRASHPDAPAKVPVDLVTASASGLDPDISVAAAEYQVARVAEARRLAPDDVRAVVRAQAERRAFGFLGEPRVNVLQLNLALDERTR